MSEETQVEAGDKTPGGLKKKMKRWGLIAGATALVLVGLLRYVPTATYTGRVQRVYEKATEYRMEFITDEGEVRVFTNREQRFPYMKFDTADVQANMEKYQREGDQIRLTAWGIRSAMFSSFPNVVNVEHVKSGVAVRAQRTERTLEAVMLELRAQQLVPPPKEAEVKERLRVVIEKANTLPVKTRD